MENNAVLDIIINLIKGAKDSENAIKYNNGNKEYTLSGTRYLLGQTIRQYGLPADHHYISTAARQRWNELTTNNENIWNYNYTEKVRCSAINTVSVNTYKGSEKSPKRINLKNGDIFEFKQIFHDEHIVPVKLIINALLDLDYPDITYANVENILNKLYICRILKDEDRQLPRTSGRTIDFDYNYNEFYKKHDIILMVDDKAFMNKVRKTMIP